MKRFRVIVIACIMLIVALTGCGKSEEKAVEGQKDTAKLSDRVINVGYYNCDHMVAGPIGEAAGIYKAHGLNVNLTGNGKVPQAMAAGQMDAGYIGARGLVASNGEGSPIVYAANNHIGGSMYLVVANDIESPEQLIGQKVEIGDPSKDEDWLCGYSKKLGLPTDPEKYDLVNIGADSDKYLALKSGQIKAYTCCDPWGSMAEFEGTGRIIANYYEMDDAMGICCAFSLNKKFIESDRELALELLRAHVDSVKYVYEHPKKAAEIFSEYYKVPFEVSMMTIYKKCVAEGRTLTWKLDEGQFEHAYNVYSKYKLVENLPPMENVIEKELHEEAKLEDFDVFIKEKIDSTFPLGMSYEDFEAKANEID